MPNIVLPICAQLFQMVSATDHKLTNCFGIKRCKILRLDACLR